MVKWFGVAQRVGRGIALLFHNCDTRRGWVVSSTPGPHFTPEKDTVPISQEAGWAPGPVWTRGKSRLHRNSIPDRPASSQSLYWLSYPAHKICLVALQNFVISTLYRLGLHNTFGIKGGCWNSVVFWWLYWAYHVQSYLLFGPCRSFSV